jgi:hypothetical protein
LYRHFQLFHAPIVSCGISEFAQNQLQFGSAPAHSLFLCDLIALN